MTTSDTAQLDDLVWVRGYADVHEALLLKEGLVMASYDAAKDLVFNNVLITLDGTEHLERRKLEASLVRPAAVAELESSVTPTIADEVLTHAAEVPAADLVRVANRIATLAIARFIGLDHAGTSDGADVLCQLSPALHEGATIEYSRRPRDEVVRRVSEAKRRYEQEFVLPALAARRASVGNSPSSASDLLSILVHASEHQPDTWTQDRITCESIHYLVAGAGTTTLTVVSAFDELLGWWERHPDDRSRMVADNEYLQHAVHEALRLHPPSAYAMRRTDREVVLSSGTRLPSQRIVALDLRAANRDASVFGDDADEFHPDRQSEKTMAMYGLAFGAGAHLCMGKRLAGGTKRTDLDSGLGTATRIVHALTTHGVRRAPDHSPTINALTTREQYLTYPVVFDEQVATVRSQ